MKKIVTAAMILLMMVMILPSAQALEDGAQLFTAAEQEALEASMEALSAQYGVQVEAVTVESIGAEDVWDYANRYFDQTIRSDGVLLLIAETERKWALLADGVGYEAVNDEAQILIEDEILPYLEEDQFFDAYARYAELCGEMLALHAAGTPYELPIPWGFGLAVSLGVGLVVGLITVSVLKGQLKSVRRRNDAREYTREGSMKLKTQTDAFLYSHVTRTPRPKESSSSHSGGGGSRGGRSGSF